MKKALSLVLALALCIGLLVSPALADGSDFVIEDGVLTGYLGPGGDVEIPYGVTKIGDRAFSDCDSLTSVYIPDGVTSIGHEAFFECSNLTYVRIPNSVTEIIGFETGGPTGAFGFCINLKGIAIPEGITRISWDDFMYSGLKYIYIPAGVTFGEIWDFQNVNLADVYYGGSEEQWDSLGVNIDAAIHFNVVRDEDFFIENGVLTKYVGLGGDIVIPDGITEIRDETFLYCDSLADVYYAGSEEQWNGIAIKADGNGVLTSATIHYNSTGRQVVPSPQGFALNGVSIGEVPAYNIDGYNYLKLRDLAALLADTGAQFAIGYDAATRVISVTTGARYTPVGGELETGADLSDTCVASPQTLEIDGVRYSLKAYNIGDYNYFQLRDVQLQELLGYSVGYDESNNIATITTK